MLETSSINTSHNNQAQNQANKEETKLKSMLQGSYDFIHRETGKMIKKKIYKRAFQLLDRFNQQRKDLELSEMVQLNRRIVNCINKILKQHLLKPDIEQQRPEVLINIFKRGTQANFEIYKYLNLYIQKVLPNEAKGIVLEDVSHLTSSDEDSQEKIQEPEVTILQFKINEYEKHLKPKIIRQESQVNPYEQEVSETSRIADIVQKSAKPLNVQFELDSYWYNLIELLLNAALIFKKAEKAKVAYFYLKEADRIGKSILETSNPNLVNVCARIKIYLANFYYETNQNIESLKEGEQAVVILQGEMRIRINQEKFVLKQNKNRERKRIKRCVSLLLSILTTITCNYEELNNYHKMMETLTTASWVAEKFIQGIDEFKKYIIKLAQEGRHRLEPYLKDLADLSYVAEQILDQELNKIRSKQREQRDDNQYLKQFNEDMYNLFQIKSLNQQLFMKQQIKQPIQQILDYKLDTENQKQPIEQSQPDGTDASINIFDSGKQLFKLDSDNDSFFDGSFFAPSIDNLQIDSKLFDEKKSSPPKQKKPRQNRRLVKSTNQSLKNQGKSVGLIKIGYERPTDYKSKILTTTQYFSEFKTVDEKQNQPFLDDGQKWKKQLSNLKYRQQPDQDQDHKQDLDVYVNKIVQSKIENGQIKDYHKMLQDLAGVQKKEEFDKKEFLFGRKMLSLKSKEALRFVKDIQRNPPVKIEVDNKVKNHAFIVDGRYNSENTLRDMKRRKIDIMVAGKKIVQSQVNLKDPEETNYLKKVLEITKKKKLKDLIYKHREALGLSKFFLNLMREQKEQERILKLRSAIEREVQTQDLMHQRDPSPNQQSKKQVRISIHSKEQILPQMASQKMVQSQGILKKPPLESIQISPIESQKLIDLQGTEFIIQQESQAKAKKQHKEQIEKQQKKSHQVIGMIIDAVERKMDSETKDLKKLLFKQKGSTKQYVDDDELTYLQFVPKYSNLSRSTYLMYIKRELAEKQQFTFEDVAMLRFQLQKKSE